MKITTEIKVIGKITPEMIKDIHYEIWTPNNWEKFTDLYGIGIWVDFVNKYSYSNGKGSAYFHESRLNMSKINEFYGELVKFKQRYNL